MKLFKHTLLFSSIYFCLSAAASNLSAPDQHDHTLYAYKDCAVVKAVPLNESQKLAYLALKEEEEHMSQLAFPLEDFEQEMQSFSSQMEALAADAINDDGYELVINHALLSEQERLGQMMQKLVQNNQIHLDALEQQGTYIAEVAMRFEQTIAPFLKDIDYDWVNISTPENPNHSKCTRWRSKM